MDGSGIESGRQTVYTRHAFLQINIIGLQYMLIWHSLPFIETVRFRGRCLDGWLIGLCKIVVVKISEGKLMVVLKGLI